MASGLRVPVAVGDFMILDAIRASGGKAVAGREAKIAEWMAGPVPRRASASAPKRRLLRRAGTDGEGGDGASRTERVVVFNTGAAPKYLEALPVELPAIDKDRVDWEAIAR